MDSYGFEFVDERIGSKFALHKFLFGSSGNPAKAFRGPGYQEQGQLLNDLFLGNVLGSNPGLLDQQRQGLQANQQQLQDLQNQLAQMPNQGVMGQNPQRQSLQDQINFLNNNISHQQAFLGNVEGTQQFQPPSFTPGQAIGGQQAPQELNFQQRNPFQFQSPDQGFQYNLTPFNAQQAVQDAFTPQAQNIQNILNRQGQLQDLGIKEDFNRRGLLASGATGQALGERQRSTNDALSNALASLAGTQANAQLGASQFGTQSQLAQQQAMYGQDYARQQQDFQRQLSQAEEIFRQQGATDQQAQMMAQNSLSRRQQGLQEIGVQNQLQRQPIEDLLKLYSFSTGATPANAPQGGLLQSLAPLASAALPLAFCLPIDTRIETESGSKSIQYIEVGDEVKGGKVIAKITKKRPKDHFFSLHEFEKGKVVMTFGHPYFDKLVSVEATENDSENTYDILTDSGFYFVNGLKLGSTIGGNNGI